MEQVADHAAAVETAVESLLAVLDAARLSQTPAIPPTQLRVLLVIASSDSTNMNRLAEALDVVPSSASRLCDRLEATGMLRRVVDPRDRREVQLVLTSAAKELLDDLRTRRRRALGDVMERMNPTSRQELVRALAAFDVAARRDSGAARPEHGDAPGLRSA
jgi:DNA-binding MarR family transcriptional regulator